MTQITYLQATASVEEELDWIVECINESGAAWLLKTLSSGSIYIQVRRGVRMRHYFVRYNPNARIFIRQSGYISTPWTARRIETETGGLSGHDTSDRITNPDEMRNYFKETTVALINALLSDFSFSDTVELPA